MGSIAKAIELTESYVYVCARVCVGVCSVVVVSEGDGGSGDFIRVTMVE